MKNQNKAKAGRTQIADISVAGKELSEEHLRMVGGGLFSINWNILDKRANVFPGVDPYQRLKVRTQL